MSTSKEQINELANFIMAEIEDEPSQDEGAVECAIRIMREQKDRIAKLEVSLCDTKPQYHVSEEGD